MTKQKQQTPTPCLEQFKTFWDSYKKQNEHQKPSTDALNEVIHLWEEYEKRIKSGDLTLDEYTNTIESVKDKKNLGRGYLCYFLEITSQIFGKSRPGDSFNYGVKRNKNKDKDKERSYGIREKGVKDKLSVTEEEAKKHFEDKIKGFLTNIVTSENPKAICDIIEKDTYSAKQVLRKMAVLKYPENFLHIYHEKTIDVLYDQFSKYEDFNEDAEECSNNQLTLHKNKALFDFFKSKNIGIEISSSDTRLADNILFSGFLYQYAQTTDIVDDDSSNIIYYGPPGTGKTFTVRQHLKFINKGDLSRCEFVQFHPSFTYEDFIEGIKPKGVTDNGSIRFELVNGVFKNFCIKAKEDPKNKYYFVVDEINRANLSSVFGETLSLLEKDYRHDPSNTESKDNLVKTQYSALIEDLIKTGDNYKELAYDYSEDNGVNFGIPNNIYFIGMMNDVDKSIDTFDLALRRRFKWIKTKCDYEVIKDETKFTSKDGSVDDFNNIEEYVQACKKLNEYISDSLALGDSYQFGHSFFMKMKDIAKRQNITKTNIKILFERFLSPTLTEYMRGFFTEKEINDKLKEALDKFQKDLVS